MLGNQKRFPRTGREKPSPHGDCYLDVFLNKASLCYQCGMSEVLPLGCLTWHQFHFLFSGEGLAATAIGLLSASVNHEQICLNYVCPFRSGTQFFMCLVMEPYNVIKIRV